MRKRLIYLCVSVYGAEAGNLALRGKATGGVHIGGGIAPKILAKLEDGTFMRLPRQGSCRVSFRRAGASYLERPGRAAGAAFYAAKLKISPGLVLEETPRHSADQGMSLEERRHEGVQGLMFRVQRFQLVSDLNIEL